PEASILVPSNLFIPIGTPFQLTGSATDAEGDALTYCWEEFDLGPQSTYGDPKGNSPAFRSYPPTSSPIRVFPRLQLILTNGTSKSEVLPDTTRNFTFRMTVRDNHPGGGGFDWKEVKFKSTYLAGPFRVTFPNSNTVTWVVGENQTVTWDVANTNASPVNCKTVNILLSTNGGSTFPIVLATGVPNIGRCCIQVPDNVSSGARIRIEAADNIFFDLSNSNFKIQQPAVPAFSFCPAALQAQACIPADFSMVISTDGVGGFSDPITLSATGLPAGATATFSPNPVTPGSPSTLSVVFPAGTSEGTFDLTVDGTSNSTVKSSVISISVINNDFSGLNLETPANGAQSVDLGPTLYWNGVVDADKYEIQVASSPSFEPGTILATNAGVSVDSFKIPLLLNEGQVCYWRVRPINGCGEGNWTKPFVFVTRLQNCTNLTANDLPKTISSSGTPTVESQIVINGGGAISDVNVKKVQGSHQFFKDLEVRLISPAGTNVLLFKDKCASYNGNFNIGFDNSGAAGFPCPPNNGNSYNPTESLNAFNGQNATGTWILRVKDNTVSSGGQLSAFELQICSSVALNAPFLVNNNLLLVTPGASGAVSTDLLKVDDPNNGPDQLVFTLMTVPQFGDLRLFGGTPLVPGDVFTQADINAGFLRYYEYGFNTGTDEFDFSATDGEGGLVSGTFHIQPFPLDAKEPSNTLSFELAPNPAHESLRLFISEPFSSDSRVSIFNAAGQQLRTWTLPAGTPGLLLDIAGLPEGVYAVSVQNEKSRGVKKVVVR
ncbi:MAG: proprotein convertase P-domain-containing protein, partial [Saprospiraceae bacterium]|nr:proprotein convertase P-domain-containing protein [Saprospiraceae bacterium]